MSDENIKPPLTYDSLAAKLSFIYDAKIAIELKGNYLKQDKATFTHRNVVNSFIAYELHTRSRDLNSKFTLGDCLFGAVKLTKNDNKNKNPEIKPYPLCVRYILKLVTLDKTWLNGLVYSFSVVMRLLMSVTLKILMKKTLLYKCLDSLSKFLLDWCWCFMFC